MVSLLLLLGIAGCESAPAAASLQEWTPRDHHSTDDDKGQASGAQAAQQPKGSAKGPSGSDTAQLVELAWRQQCVNCHGTMGHGDGPMGPMLHAPDLTSVDMQSKVSDAELAVIIKNGKDKMPAFNLPDPVLVGLVARIRQLKGR